MVKTTRTTIFQQPGKPEKLRTAHLQNIDIPILILQGTRDPFGKKTEVEQYDLDSRIQIQWIEDGEHSFKTNKSSKLTWSQTLDLAATKICSFANQI